MQELKDLFAYGFSDLFVNLFIYSIVVIPFFLIFWVYLKRKFQNRRIQERQRSKPTIIRQEIGYSIVSILIFTIIDIGLYAGQKHGYTLLYNDVSKYGWGYFIFSILLMIVLHDAWFFFTHRLMHHPKLFKHVHRVHHRSVDPSPFAAFSFHPLEAIIEGAVYVIFSFLFPVHLLALLAWQFLQMILNVIGHLGYEIYPKGFNTHWLFKWKTPSTHHNMHHAKFNGNYGLYFTWWDRIFKTEFKDYNETYEKVQERIGTKTRNTSVLLVLLFANLSTFAQNEIVGQWLSENKKGITTIYEQDGKYWGKITWLKTPKDETGKPMADKENPDKKLRNQALQGLLILKNFVYKNNGWRDGNIYDPERGKTFTCTLVLTNAKTLKVRGYWGIFYETQFWTRV